jgi:hypothetical protein
LSHKGFITSLKQHSSFSRYVKTVPFHVAWQPDPWWNDIERGKLLTCPSELSGDPSSKAGETDKGNGKSFLMKYLFCTLKGSLTYHKIL